MDLALDLARTALVVIDVQDGIAFKGEATPNTPEQFWRQL